MNTIDRPVPFPGTKEERDANFRSHRWWPISDDEILCAECDSKPWHAAAFYPCGAWVPRETATVDPADLGQLHPGFGFLSEQL